MEGKMEEKELLKKVDEELKKIEVRFFIKQGLTINADVKERIKFSIRTLHNTTFEDCSVNIKLTNKYKVNIKKRYSIQFTIEKIDNTKVVYDKYNYKGIYYDNLDGVKENKLYDEILKVFEMNEEDALNISDYIDNIKHLMINNSFKTYSYSYQNYDVELSKELKEKFFQAFEVLPCMVEFYKKRTKPIRDFYYIHSVIEGKNCRWALVFGGRHNDYKIMWFRNESDIFNYIDVNRTIYLKDSYDSNWIAFDITTEKEIESYPNLFMDYTKYVTSLDRIDDDNMWNTFIDNNSLISARTTFILAEKKREREKAIIAQKNKVWEDSLNKMHIKPLEKNGIAFSQYSMIYEEIELNTHTSFNFSTYLREVGVDAIADFNTIFTSAITSIVGRWIYSADEMPWQMRNNINLRAIVSGVNSKTKLQFTIDGKDIIVSRKGNYYLINGIRINKNELAECITHSLCYQKIEDYKIFLESVSKCSLKFHTAIVNGIKKSFSMNGDYVTIEIKIERKKNLNFIVEGKNRYRVRDSNRLIDNQNLNYEQFIYLLLSITELQISNMKGVIGDAKKRYEVAIKKAEELFKRTCKMFDVRQETIKGKKGWALTGKSGNRYLINDKGNNDYGIYRVKNDHLDYVCIVDKSAKNQVGKDKLVSRIYALANDSLIANEVHTLKGRV